jgi:hypothetical protein
MPLNPQCGDSTARCREGSAPIIIGMTWSVRHLDEAFSLQLSGCPFFFCYFQPVTCEILPDKFFNEL